MSVLVHKQVYDTFFGDVEFRGRSPSIEHSMNRLKRARPSKADVEEENQGDCDRPWSPEVTQELPKWCKPDVGNDHYRRTTSLYSGVRDGYTPRYLDIDYPIVWHAPERRDIAMFAQRAEDETVKWAVGLGMLSEARLRKMGVGEYAGRSLPMANYPHSVLFAKFLVVFLLWDDVVEDGQDASGEIECICEQFSMNPPPVPAHLADNKWVKAWKNIAEEAIKLGASEAWMGRYLTGFKWWLDWTIRQREVQDCKMVEEVGLQHVIDCRLGSSGSVVSASFVELSMGIELPAAAAAHPNWDIMVNQHNIIVGMANEMFSLGKDMADADPQGRWGNIVWCHRYLENRRNKEYGSLLESVAYVRNVHDEAVRLFDEQFDNISSWVDAKDVDIVQNYMSLLRYYSRGLAVWQAVAPRYNSDFAVDVRNKAVLRTRLDAKMTGKK